MRRHVLLALAALPLLAGCALFDNGLADAPLHVVFFDVDSTALNPAAEGIVANAARVAVRNPLAPVVVLGFAGPFGNSDTSRALSAQRAETVAAGLRTAGVAASRISIQPRGEVPYEMMPVESRRVEIRIGDAQVAR
jgi:outer membrane protein OmpA-like peptidoglycan-associated protein